MAHWSPTDNGRDVFRHIFFVLQYRSKSRQSKVCNFGIEVRVKEDVTSFDVSVEHWRVGFCVEVENAFGCSQCNTNPHPKAQ
ncbi:hypothetical protein CARUB_v10012734mg [Capsella rubella]|uniref:Uncharacterized protein n=1 Tax=Capsella rubella TaxID=81985 RepID=R0GIX7_9BRAS|nr:hypothetical protein CARUB_v10012734mg [Capsella rubella]